MYVDADEEKEKEIQIGLPTDVKHVAHIGWDGPSTDNPSWMKEFNGPGQFQSAPLVPPPADIAKENPEIQWVSEDSNRRSRNANPSSAGDPPKSTRRHSSSKENGATDSPKKSRSSRRHHRKDSADGSKNGRIQLDSAAGSESPAIDLPDIPKKSRRKKPKESVPGGGTVAGSRSSKSKGTSSSSTATASDTGSRPDPVSESSRNSESIIS
ncbi:hypothetical protein K7X08_029690 [Anisodus acutangulus]|uniref:CRIB domain-containing protein n=1 Tax=Anisodus acutangulus TaxID=402998 RepID=A0A9Q1L4S3_9SOLA|nr:hypothetical protein K7X08_029690 [Anisodus acutangulus]